MNKMKNLNSKENNASLIASQQLGGFVDTTTAENASISSVSGELVNLMNIEGNVFQRRGKVSRTPPPNNTGETTASKENENDILLISLNGIGGTSENKGRTNENPTPGMPTPPYRQLTLGKSNGMEEELQRCKSAISKMKAATYRQKNISNDIKIGLFELEDAIGAIAYGVSMLKKPEIQLPCSTRLQQTPETPITAGRQKRSASSPADQRSYQEKKAREETANVTEEVAWERQESKRERRRRNLEAKAVENKKLEGIKPPGESKIISTTQGKPNNRRRKRRRYRPEALIIRPMEGKSYADVLGEIRSKVKPEDSEVEVHSIRQTRTGDVLLELGPNSKNKDGFFGALRGALGEQGRILNLQSKISVEIRDIDGFTTEQEVTAAIKRDIPEVEDIKINLFPCIRGQKVAIIEMSDKWATKLINEGRIKIGWVYCRVRERAVVMRCFRCSGYGHMAKDCKGPDRSKLCYKCFGAGHKARVCTGAENCMLCTEKGIEQTKLTHFPGSGKCKVYREALQVARKRT